MISTQAAAELLGVSPRTINRYARLGILPRCERDRWDEKDVLAVPAKLKVIYAEKERRQVRAESHRPDDRKTPLGLLQGIAS